MLIDPRTPSPILALSPKKKAPSHRTVEHSVLVLAFVFIVLVANTTPNTVWASWHWYSSVNAASDTVVPNAQTPVLEAATNSNPNPSNGFDDTIETSDDAVLAYAGPSGTIADIANMPPPDRISVYVVQPGDTLSSIAAMFGVSINTIIWANNLTGTKDVHPGDSLVILPVSGTEHVVTKDDTLQSIAKTYGADETEIAQYNGLDPSAPLSIGSTIIIPGGEIAGVSDSPDTGTSHTSSKVTSMHSTDGVYEPYLGGSGPAQLGYYSNPLPGGIITQSIHGWNAVDIAAPRGTPILAAANGTVIVVRDNGGWNGGYGNYVVITHPNGTQTLYAHMTNAIVTVGQAVSNGEIIGFVGKTGFATGPHLHFEVRGAENPFANCPVGSSCSPE